MAACALVLMVAVTLWACLRQGFLLLDDEIYVTGNSLVRNGLIWSNLPEIFRDGRLANWIPVTELSHAVDCQFYGLQPAGHHFSSLLLHCINTALVFYIFLRMTNAFWRSLFVGAIFGLHPLHVESVVWISERKDVLSTFFFLLTLLTYAGYAARISTASADGAKPGNAGPSGRRCGGFYVASLLFFALGLMSKPMLVTVPCVLLLLDYWPLRRFQAGRGAGTSFGRLLLEKAPFLVLAVADGFMTVWAQRSAGATEAITAVPLGARIANAVVSSVLYLAKTFWPAKLAVFYPFPPPWPAWQVLGAGLFLGAITVLVFRTRKRQPYQLFGWLWFGITLGPVLGIVQVGAQGMADRYMYIPQIGIVVLLSWTVAEFVGTMGLRKWVWIPALAAVFLCGWLTRAQVARWNSNEILFRHTLALTKRNALAHYCLGTALAQRQAFAEAATQFEAALAIQPDYPMAEVALGISLAAKGHSAEAVKHFEAAVRLAPRLAAAHYNLATMLAAGGDIPGALTHFDETTRLNPEFPGAQRGLAEALKQSGHLNDALAHYHEAVRQKPEDVSSRIALGRLLAAQGQFADAMSQFAAAATADPKSAEAQNSLGWALATQGRGAEAADRFANALKLKPDYAEAHYNLANVLVQQGKNEEASSHFEQALRQQPEFADAHRQFALMLAGRREWAVAARHFQEAIRLHPDDTTALEEFAWLRATAGDASVRDGAEAGRLARRAVELTGEREIRALETLAAAQAEAGQFDDAIQTLQLALEGASALKEIETAGRLQDELKNYRARKPWRQ